MRITKDMVFSVDRGTDAELAQTLKAFRLHNVDFCFSLDSDFPIMAFNTENADNTVYNSMHKLPIHYTPSEFLARFGSVDDAPVSESQNHDEHYQRIEARGVEPIAVMESIVCAGLPEQYHAIAKRNLSLALGVKYALRLGEKDAPEKELAKMDNYLHRAQCGEWRK